MNSRHPSPRREEGVLRGAGQVAFRPDPRDPVIEFREVIFCRQAADIRAICPELEVQFLTKAQVLDGGVGVCPK